MTETERQIKRQILISRIDMLYALRHLGSGEAVEDTIKENEKKLEKLYRKPDQSKRARNMAQRIS